MTWAKFDDLYDDNRKVKRAWRTNRAAVGLHVMAITYCSRHETDGLIDVDWLEEKLPQRRERDQVLGCLTRLGLFEVIDPETYLVHDYLHFQRPRAELEEFRRKDAERKARGRTKRVHADSTPDSKRNPNRGKSDSARPVPSYTDAPHPSDAPRAPGPSDPTHSSARPAADPTSASSNGSPTQASFAAWIESTGKTERTVLTRKRRELIEKWLDVYSEDELIDAVRGWRHSPHHRGENKDGTVYNDLELILRDAAHIEKFRDLERGHSHAGEDWVQSVNSKRKGDK